MIDDHHPRPGTVNCPECGRPCLSNAGLGRHRAMAHGIRGARNGSQAGRVLPASIEVLAGETGPTVLQRLRAFPLGATPDAGVVVIGDTWGPKVVSRRYIADMVAQAGEPLLVLTFEQLAAKVAP